MKIRSTVMGLAAALTLAQAQTPAYLKEMPPVDRVMAAMQTADRDETAARQMGAFWQLRKMIEDVAGPRRYRPGLSADEQKLWGEYAVALARIQKSKPEYQRFTAMRGYDVSPQFRAELLQKLFPPSFAAEYAKLTGQANVQFQAQHDARIQAEKAAQAEANKPRAPTDTEVHQAAMRRCVATGRDPQQCLQEELGKSFNQTFGGMMPSLASKPQPAGLRLSGVYQGQGGFSIEFHPEFAELACRGVSMGHPYTMEVKGGRVLVRVQHNDGPLLGGRPGGGYAPLQDSTRPFDLVLRPDGKLAGSGPIQVTGAVAAGTTSTVQTFGPTTTTTTERQQIDAGQARYYNQSDVHKNGTEYSVDVQSSHTTYGPTGTQAVANMKSQTESCTLGLLTLTGAAPASLAENMKDVAFGALSADPQYRREAPPPGIRLNGTYTGQGGLEVEFHPDSAMVSCGEAAVADKYAAHAEGDHVVVSLEHQGKTVPLAYSADGKLTGAGTLGVNGRVITGRDANGNIAYAPKSATCALGVLAPAKP